MASEKRSERIGDDERNEASEMLQEHLAKGRLDNAEFDERIGAILSAKTWEDIDPLFRDLPEPKPAHLLPPPPTPQGSAYDYDPFFGGGSSVYESPNTPVVYRRSSAPATMWTFGGFGLLVPLLFMMFFFRNPYLLIMMLFIAPMFFAGRR